MIENSDNGSAQAALHSSGTTGPVWQLLDQVAGIVSARSERERAQRDALVVFAIRVGSAGLLYLSQVALARWIGSEAYGIYVVVWTTVLVLGGLSSVGLNQAVLRLVPEYRERGNSALLAGLLSSSRTAAFAIGTTVAACGIGLLHIYSDVIARPFVAPAFLALVCLPMYALTDVQDGIGRGRSWIGIALLPPYVLRPLLVVVAMAVSRLAGLPMSAATAIGSAIVATWGAGLLQLWLMERRLAPERSSEPPVTDWRNWLAVSLPLMGVTGAEIALQSADVLILSRWVTAGDIAIYYAAAKTMSLLLYVHYAVGSAAAHRLAALSARGDRAALEAAVSETVSWTFWPSVAAGLSLLTLGKPLLWLFGPDFGSGFSIMLILVIGCLARSAVGPSDVILRVLGQHKLSAAISMSTALLNVVLLVALIPPFGLTGAACATTIALATEAGCNWLAARRRLGLEIGIWNAR